LKKNCYILFLILVCIANAIYAQTLDTTIGTVAGGLSGKLPRGSTVVMIEFETASEDLANHVIDEINHNLVTVGSVRPVERRRLNAIRSELSLSIQGEVGDDFAQRIGHMLGAQYIILGSISSVADQYIIRFRAITTETATIVWSFSQSIRSDIVIDSFLRTGGNRTANAPVTPVTTTTPTASAAPVATTAPAASLAPTTTVSSAGYPVGVVPSVTPPAPALRTYRIGDIGPAGGLIFYDKGNNSGGWRYLEAAPVEAEFQTRWSVHGTNVDNTRDGIGNGRRNTQLIIDKFKQTAGEWDTAAQTADTLVFNGFNDWFLPSQAELDQMYGNLKRRNLGDFKDEEYWSSTENSSIRRDAFYQNFRDGRIASRQKTWNRYIRPIREVPGP